MKAATRRVIRSLAARGTAYANDLLLGTDPQPGIMKNKFKGTVDNGGVHINFGITILHFVRSSGFLFPASPFSAYGRIPMFAINER